MSVDSVLFLLSSCDRGFGEVSGITLIEVDSVNLIVTNALYETPGLRNKGVVCLSGNLSRYLLRVSKGRE